jgi:iron complex transport system substrate-binding protein
MPAIARRTLLGAVPVGALAAVLTGCGAASVAGQEAAEGGSDGGASDGGSGTWPRTIEHEKGSTEIPSAPQRIVSTSVVLTGSLLAIDAPVFGSGGTAPNVPGTDEDGYFEQWGDIARERGVKALYDNSELDLEAVQAAAPDLIIISSIGGDSTADQYDQLAEIAPTIALDYNSTPWEEVTTTLGGIVGREEQAKKALADYEKAMAKLADEITPPAEPVQAIAYQGESGAAFALSDGPHAKLLAELGITVADLPDGAKVEEGRGDVAFLSPEAAVTGLTAKDVLLIDGDDDTLAAMTKDPLYKEVPAMQGGTITPLGHPSFKLDYFAALDMAEHVRDAYGD